MFAISMQPLIAYLDHGLAVGTITGLPVASDLKLAHRLLADDAGICIPATEIAFQQIREAIRKYESASGAKLNLEKSIIVRVALPTIPSWITAIGCHITQPHEIVKYRGTPFGTQLTTQAIQIFCLNRLAAKIVKLKTQKFSFTN
jgi:hypothetical protein